VKGNDRLKARLTDIGIIERQSARGCSHNCLKHQSAVRHPLMHTDHTRLVRTRPSESVNIQENAHTT